MPGYRCHFDSSGLVDGDYYAGLQINSDDPDEPMVTMPVTLTVAAGPEIVVAPGSMTTFQPPNTTFARTLSIGNLGPDDLAWVIAEQWGGVMELALPNQTSCNLLQKWHLHHAHRPPRWLWEIGSRH